MTSCLLSLRLLRIPNVISLRAAERCSDLDWRCGFRRPFANVRRQLFAPMTPASMSIGVARLDPRLRVTSDRNWRNDLVHRNYVYFSGILILIIRRIWQYIAFHVYIWHSARSAAMPSSFPLNAWYA